MSGKSGGHQKSAWSYLIKKGGIPISIPPSSINPECLFCCNARGGRPCRRSFLARQGLDRFREDIVFIGYKEIHFWRGQLKIIAVVAAGHDLVEIGVIPAKG